MRRRGILRTTVIVGILGFPSGGSLVLPRFPLLNFLFQRIGIVLHLERLAVKDSVTDSEDESRVTEYLRAQLCYFLFSTQSSAFPSLPVVRPASCSSSAFRGVENGRGARELARWDGQNRSIARLALVGLAGPLTLSPVDMARNEQSEGNQSARPDEIPTPVAFFRLRLRCPGHEMNDDAE